MKTAKLSNTELLLLDFLIYAYDGYRRATSVGELATLILDDLKKFKKPSRPAFSTRLDWLTICGLVLDNQKLSAYQITKPYHYEDLTVFTAVDRLPRPTDVNVIFQGTATLKGWDDNAVGSYVVSSPDQKRSLKYVRSLPLRYGRHLTLSGHSKGGNRAMYSTLRSRRVARAVAYDAQGFSPEFLRRYRRAVARRASLITAISAANDPVHGFLYQPPGIKNIYIKTRPSPSLFGYHKLNLLIDRHGQFRDRAANGEVPKYFARLTSAVAELDNTGRSKMSHTLVDIVKMLIEHPTDAKNLAAFRKILSNTPELVDVMLKVR